MEFIIYKIQAGGKKMTVIGLSRLKDLIGITRDEIESRNVEYALNGIDEMQEIINKLPDDDDSRYVLSTMFTGTKLNQVLAQLEVLKHEGDFMITLEHVLMNEKIKQKIREIID